MKHIRNLILVCAIVTMLICNMASEQVSATDIANSPDSTTVNNGLETCANTIKDVYKMRYPADSEIIDEIVDEITTDSVFIECYISDGAIVFQIVEDSLNDVLNPKAELILPYVIPLNPSVSVPVVNQLCYDSNGKALYTYCGPAAALQALIGNGKIENTTSNKSPSMVYSVGQSMGTDSSGTNITKLNNYIMNYYSSTAPTYKVKAFTKYSYTKAKNFVILSLAKGAAPVVRVKNTSLLDYYNGYNCGHYVTISAINVVDNTITVVDPNYDLTYRGSHTITMDEFEAIMMDDGWMCIYTDVVSDEPYVYE